MNGRNNSNPPLQRQAPANIPVSPFPPGVPPNSAPPGLIPQSAAPPGAVPQNAATTNRIARNAPAAGTSPQSFGTPHFMAAGNEADNKKTDTAKKDAAHSYMVSFFIKLGVTAAALAVLLTFIIGLFVCHDNSSYPMIKDGDLCLSFRLAKYKQGDEIAYRGDDGSIRFGRVVALEGDSVEISNAIVLVNGYGVYENTVYETTAFGSSIDFPYTVPDGCVFVLNDHRDDITDSRTFGAIPVSRAKGRIFLIMRRRGI